jgi:phosphatidylglycerol:prolipoprotein diacylglycerol transferase
MLPILAVVPPLPFVAFAVLSALCLLAGAGLTARNYARVAGPPAEPAATEAATKTADDGESPFTPLAIGAFVVALLWVWSRNEVKLHSYGLLLIVGFVAAAWDAAREARRRGVDPNIIGDLALPLLLVCIACCRVLYVALNRSQFSSPAQWVRIWDGGLSFHGALVGAVAVVAFYGWKSRLGFWRLADIIAPSVFLGYAFGRLGCFLNGCCYGEPCALPWAMVFRVEGGPAGALTPPSHPAQLYSAILAVLLWTVMRGARVRPTWNRFPGQLTLLFFALYAVERFIIEIFRRGATARTVLGTDWLTEAQLISVGGMVFIAAFWLVQSRRRRPQVLASVEPGLETNLEPSTDHVSAR